MSACLDLSAYLSAHCVEVSEWTQNGTMYNVPSEHGISSGQLADKTGRIRHNYTHLSLHISLQYFIMWSKSLPMLGRMPKGSTELAPTALGVSTTAGVVLLRRASCFFCSSSYAFSAAFFAFDFGSACPLRLVISRFLFTHSRAFFRTTVSFAGSKLSRNSSFVKVCVGTSIEKVGCICWKNLRPLLSFLWLARV